MSSYEPKDYVKSGERKWHFIKFKREVGTSSTPVADTAFQYNIEGTTIKTNGHQFVIGYKNNTTDPIMVGNLFDSSQTTTYGSWTTTDDTVNKNTTSNGNDQIIGTKNIKNVNGTGFDIEQYFTFYFNVETGKYYWFGSYVHVYHTTSPFSSLESGNIIFMFRVEGIYTKGTTDLFSDWAGGADMFSGLNAGISRFDATKGNKVYGFTWNLPRKEANVFLHGEQDYEVTGSVFDWDGEKVIANATKLANYIPANPTIYDLSDTTNKFDLSGQQISTVSGQGGYGYMAVTICEDMAVVAVQYNIKWYKYENNTWVEKGTIVDGPKTIIKCKMKKSYDGEFFLMAAGDRYSWMYKFNSGTNTWIRDNFENGDDSIYYANYTQGSHYHQMPVPFAYVPKQFVYFGKNALFYDESSATYKPQTGTFITGPFSSNNYLLNQPTACCGAYRNGVSRLAVGWRTAENRPYSTSLALYKSTENYFNMHQVINIGYYNYDGWTIYHGVIDCVMHDNTLVVVTGDYNIAVLVTYQVYKLIDDKWHYADAFYNYSNIYLDCRLYNNTFMVGYFSFGKGVQAGDFRRGALLEIDVACGGIPPEFQTCQLPATINNVLDTTNTKIRLMFSAEIAPNSSINNNDFIVRADGGQVNTTNVEIVNGDVIVTIQTAITKGQVVTINYGNTYNTNLRGYRTNIIQAFNTIIEQPRLRQLAGIGKTDINAFYDWASGWHNLYHNNNNIYMFTSSVYKYSIETNTWSKPSQNTPGYFTQQSLFNGGFEYNGKIYTYGYNSGFKMDIYDIGGDSWSSLTSTGNPDYVHQGGMVYNNEYYTFGGATVQVSYNGFPTGTSFYKFSPDTNVWTEITLTGDILPVLYAGFTMNMYNNEIYIFGGTTNIDQDDASNDVYKVNIANSTITKVTMTGEMPIPCFFHSSYIVGDNLFILGGVTKTNGNHYNTLNQSRILNLTTNTWSINQYYNNSIPMYHLSSVVVGDKIYLFSAGYARYEQSHTPYTRPNDGLLLIADHTNFAALGDYTIDNLVGVIFLKKLEFSMPVNMTGAYEKMGTEYKNGANGRCYNVIDRYGIQYNSTYNYWNLRDVKVWPTFQFPYGYTGNSTNWDILDKDGVSQKTKIFAQAMERNGQHAIFNYAFNISSYKPINPNCGVIGEGLSIDEIDMFGLEGSWNDSDNEFSYVYYVAKDKLSMDAVGDTVDVYIKFLKKYKPKYWTKEMYSLPEDPDYHYLFICTFKNIVGSGTGLANLIVYDSSKEVKETEIPVNANWGIGLENAFISYGDNYKIILTFDTIITTPETLSTSPFTVKVNGVSTTINSVSLNSEKGYNNEVHLSIAASPVTTDTVTVSYEEPTIIAQRFGASDTRYINEFADYNVIVQGFKYSSMGFLYVYSNSVNRYSYNLFRRAVGYSPSLDYCVLASSSSSWEKNVGKPGFPYINLHGSVNKTQGSFLGSFKIYNKADEYKNNFLSFPSNWFQIGSTLTEPAGFDANISSTSSENVIYANAGVGPTIEGTAVTGANNWTTPESMSHYVILWNRVKEGFCYFKAKKTAAAWNGMSEQHRLEMPGDNDYYYLFMFKFVGKRSDAEEDTIQGIGDLYEFFANHTTYKTDYKNLSVFQAKSPTNVHSILKSHIDTNNFNATSTYYQYPDGTLGYNTGIAKKYYWETTEGDYSMPRQGDVIAPTVTKAYVHNTNHQQVVIYFDEELKFGLDLNPEDFIITNNNVVNPVNTLKYEGNVLILNLNNTIIINEVVTFTYTQKYTAGTRNIMDYLSNVQISFSNFVVENNAGATAVRSAVVLDNTQSQNNIRVIELTYSKNFLTLTRFIKPGSFELKVNNVVNEIAIIDVETNKLKLYYEDLIPKDASITLSYSPDENYFFKLKDVDKTPIPPFESIVVTNNSTYEVISEIVIQALNPELEGSIVLGPLGLELGFKSPMLTFLGESEVNTASKHHITDVSHAIVCLKWNTDLKAVRNGFHHASGNFWSSANNSSSNFVSGKVGITTTQDFLWLVDKQIPVSGWSMNDFRVKVLYIKDGTVKELHLFYSLDSGINWYKWNVLTSTGTTVTDDITSFFANYSSTNFTQTNLVHVYVNSPSYPKRQKMYKRMTITPGGNDFVWPPDMSGVTSERHYKFDNYVSSSWLSIGEATTISIWSNLDITYPGDGNAYPTYFPSITNYYVSFGMLAGRSCFHKFYHERPNQTPYHYTAQLRNSNDSMGASSNIHQSNNSSFLAHDGRDNILRYSFSDMLDILDPKVEMYFWAADADSYFNKGHMFFSLQQEAGKKKQYYEWNVLTHKDYGSKPIFHGFPIMYEKNFPGPFDYKARFSAPGFIGTLDQYSSNAEWYDGNVNFHGRQNAWDYQGYGLTGNATTLMEWKSNFTNIMGPVYDIHNSSLPGGGRMTIRGFDTTNTTDNSLNEIINSWNTNSTTSIIKADIEYVNRLPELFDPGIPEKPIIVKIDLNENLPKKLIMYFSPEIIKGTPRKQDFRVKLNGNLIDFSSVILTEVGNIEIDLFNRIVEHSDAWPQELHVSYIKPSIVDFQIGADIRTDTLFDKKVNNNINLPEPILVVATVENSGITDASLISATNTMVAADISANSDGVFEITSGPSIQNVENDTDSKKRVRTQAFVTKILERLTAVTLTSSTKFEKQKGAVITKELLAFPAAIAHKIKNKVRIFPTDVVIKTQDVKEEETIYIPIQENQSCTIRISGVDYRFGKRKIAGLLKTLVTPEITMPTGELKDTFEDGESVVAGGHLIIFGSIAVQAEPATIHIPILFTVNALVKVEDSTSQPALNPFYEHRHRFSLNTNFLSAEMFQESFSFIRARTTYTVTIIEVDGNKKYALDGDIKKELFLKNGMTYTFDLSYNTTTEPAFKFSKILDGKHVDPNSTDFTTGITEISNPPKITVEVPSLLPGSDFVVGNALAGSIYYYGSTVSDMGGKLNVGEKEALFIKNSDASLNLLKNGFISDLTTFSTSKILHDVSWATIKYDADGNPLLNSDGSSQVDISFGYVQTRNGVEYENPITSYGGNSIGDIFLRYVATHLTGHPLGQAFIKNDTQFIDDINGNNAGQAQIVNTLFNHLILNLTSSDGEYNDVLFSIYSQIYSQQRSRIGAPSVAARPFPLLPNDNLVLYVDGRVNLLNDGAYSNADNVLMKNIFPQSSFPYMEDDTGQLNAGVWMITITLK